MTAAIVLHVDEHGRIIPLAHTPPDTANGQPFLDSAGFPPSSWPTLCNHELGEGWVYQQAGALTNTPHCPECAAIETKEAA